MSTEHPHFDIAIVGAGMAGAALAYHLAGRRSVVLIEREEQPGYHATGRSAAIFIPTYGNRHVRLLTRASTSFLAQPPTGFAQAALLSPRGYLRLCLPGEEAALRAHHADVAREAPEACLRSADFAAGAVPILRANRIGLAMHVADAQEIDVAALHSGFLRGHARAGGELMLNAEVLALSRDKTCWRAETRTGAITATTLVNAAGAWGDVLASMAGVAPLGLSVLRRSAALLPGPSGHDAKTWPMVTDLNETYYFKPDAGKLLVSPAEEIPSEPMDAWVDDLDLAEGLQRFSDATTMEVTRVDRSWAGLRTFARDRSPVIGFDPAAPDFFWSVGQGGYGIQTAPAWGELAANLLCGASTDKVIEGLDIDALNPNRFA